MGKVQFFPFIIPANIPVRIINSNNAIVKRIKRTIHWGNFFVPIISCIAFDCSGALSGTIRNIPMSITDCSKHSAERTVSRFAIPRIIGTIRR